jgi:hypothetical protein
VNSGRRRAGGPSALPAATLPAATLLVAASICAPGAVAGPVAGAIPPCIEGRGDHCGFVRPEDLAAVDRDGRWLLVSQGAPEAPLVLLDTATGRRAGVAPPPAATPVEAVFTRPRGAAGERCPGPPLRIEAGGNDVRRVAGRPLAAVVNRAGPTRIELYDVRVDAVSVPALRWRDCVPVPDGVALNDVALGPDGEIYASQMFDPPRDADAAAALRSKFLAAAPTGRALRWTAASGWQPVPGTAASFANGIAVSNDGRWLALAGTFDQAVLLLPRARGRASTRAPRRVPLRLQPDNLTRDGAAGFVVAGHTGTPVTGIDPCRSLRDAACGFPFAVSRVDARAATAAQLYREEGRATPGASVAVATGAGLYLGSAFGDRVALRHTRDGSNEP